MPAECPPDVLDLIQLAKREDLGQGDITSSLLPNPHQPAHFHLLAKQPGVFAGESVAHAILSAYDPSMTIEWADSCRDGWSWTENPTVLATISGPIATLLAVERVLLNFLQRMCGVATLARKFVEAVADTSAEVYDTRKTIPGWRSLDKLAVRCGGGQNHRASLNDAVLIKDNHLAGVPPGRLAFAVFEMLNRIDPAGTKPAFVQVECASLAQLEPLLSVTGIDSILLDNFDVKQLRTAVSLRDSLGLRDKVSLEASGGVTLATVASIAETGVDRISVGALTHSAVAIDLSMERM